MRVTGGQLKGRPIERPKTNTVRPITSMVCQALFNILGPVDGLTVLDAYAGSGAIGIEALSRGAMMVEGVEASRSVAKVIYSNINKLGLEDRYIVTVAKVEDWLRWPNSTSLRQFEVIVAGPPFAKIDQSVIEGLVGRLAIDGILVVWHTSRLAPPELKSVKLVQTKTYGDSALSFYKK